MITCTKFYFFLLILITPASRKVFSYYPPYFLLFVILLWSFLVFSADQTPHLYGFWIPSSQFATFCGITTSGWLLRSLWSCYWLLCWSSSSTQCRDTPSKRWWELDRFSLPTGSYGNFRCLPALVSWPVESLSTDRSSPVIACHRNLHSSTITLTVLKH